jgi:hypothetical protein
MIGVVYECMRSPFMFVLSKVDVVELCIEVPVVLIIMKKI